MTLTRLQFYTACKAFLDSDDSNPASDAIFKRYSEGWSWKEHDLFPGLGYLSRSVLLLGDLRDSRGYSAQDYSADLHVEVEKEDNASAEQSSEEVLTCRQYVVYSPTFQVPALYFNVHRPSA
ncbi:hypothetical protein PHLCEN_2v10522 [Hermanssonia centrifuga]|uniref:Uncharacterized protein n=1 Tax=Hermanssonia centrifuga TaxID=98765 RepID=A0A2R6NMI2_9APHY|nr:hypothetical protein PHLCEN_2v10522 [Hermanssonia centrifuga]